MSNESLNISANLVWAYLKEPNTKGEYASNKYQVTLEIDKATAVMLKKRINVKQKIKEENGKYFITVKSTNKPIVKLANKTTASDEVLGKIGNGTSAIVKINFYSPKGKKEVFAGLNAILLKKIVEYNNDPFADIEAEEVEEVEEAPFDTTTSGYGVTPEGASEDDEDLI